MDCILAIDIGSSSARALLFGRDGQEISGFESHIPYQVSTTEAGAWEIDAAALTQIAVQVIDAIHGRTTLSDDYPLKLAYTDGDSYLRFILGPRVRTER